MRGLIKDERGQASVELVIVLPVMAMLLVILVDALVFLEECARFDHLAPQAVLAQAGSSASVKGEQAECAAAVASVLDTQFPGDQRHVVVSTRTQGPAVVYECTLSMSLWPFSKGCLFGIEALPAVLSHTTSLGIYPYEIGGLS